jgi:signal transduction histidine kinase
MRSLVHLIIYLALLLYLTTVPGPGVLQAREETLRIGCYNLADFIRQDADGSYEGYGADYLEMLSRYTGYKFQVVVAPNAELTRRLQSGELDLLMPVGFTQERRRIYAFTSYPLGEQITGLYTLKQNYNLYYEDFKNFQDLRIGSVEKTYIPLAMAEYAREHHFTYREKLYPSLAALHQALEQGQVDAVCRSGMGGIPLDYRLVAITSINPFYMVAPLAKADGPLKKIDAALRKINYERPNFTGDLHTKYFSSSQGTVITGLTREELEYLEEKKTISVALLDDRYPVAYRGFQDGKPDGILKDLLDQISLKTELTFVYHLVPEGTNLLTYLRSGKADLVAGLVNTENLQKNYAIVLSDGLLPTVTAIAGRRGQVFDPGHSYRAAIPANDEGTIAHLRKVHPHFKLQTYASPRAALQAVQDGRADITMQNSIILSALLQHAEFSDLSLWYTASEEGNYSYCVAERSTFDPRLISILDKGIRSLNKTEVQNIILRQEARADKGTTFRDYLARYRVALPVTLLLILVVAGGIAYNIRSRQRHLAELERQNAELARANALAQSAMEASRQANAAKTDFLARMSHDIRTPLNGVIGMTALAREKNRDLEVRSFLEKIDISSHYLLGLVNDLLDLTKINAGKMELHPEPYTPPGIFAVPGQRHQPHVPVQADYVSHPESAPINYALLVDKLKYNQIIFNLLSNAVKFTPRGGRVLPELCPRLPGARSSWILCCG